MLSAIKKLFTPPVLNIRTVDFNLVLKKPLLMKKLRSLTLDPHSGMNYELNNWIRISKTRQVKCKVILTYQDRKLIAWAFLSQEPSDFHFMGGADGYHPSQGYLFQVFVHPHHRRKGIGSKLIKEARRQIGENKLCICPWDYVSFKFFDNFKKQKIEML